MVYKKGARYVIAKNHTSRVPRRGRVSVEMANRRRRSPIFVGGRPEVARAAPIRGYV